MRAARPFEPVDIGHLRRRGAAVASNSLHAKLGTKYNVTQSPIDGPRQSSYMGTVGHRVIALIALHSLASCLAICSRQSFVRQSPAAPRGAGPAGWRMPTLYPTALFPGLDSRKVRLRTSTGARPRVRCAYGYLTDSKHSTQNILRKTFYALPRQSIMEG